MAAIIGGGISGTLDSSLFLLNRQDRTHAGSAGDGEAIYANVASGALVLQHLDSLLPSRGEDFSWIRTYNSSGRLNAAGKPWSYTASLDLSLNNVGGGNKITLLNADGSEFAFTKSGSTWTTVDGAGAHQTITFDGTAYTLTRADQSTLKFNSSGTLTESRDTNGNTITYTYAAGRLSSIQDDTAHTIIFGYTGAGDLETLTDETGTVLVKYGYDGAHNLTSVTDRNGQVTGFHYTGGVLDRIDLPTQVDRRLLESNDSYYRDWRKRLGYTELDGSGLLAEHLTDTQKNAIRTAASTSARSISFEYTTVTRAGAATRVLSAIVDADGNRTEFKYSYAAGADASGTTDVVSALGLKRMKDNTDEYRNWRIANGYYASWSQAAYDSGSIRAQADGILAAHTTRYSFDAAGQILAVRNPDGWTSKYEYQNENLTAIQDALADAVTKSDDAYYRNLRKDLGFVYTSGAEVGQGKRYLDLTTGAGGEVEQLRARFTTKMTYDARGNLLTKTDGLGNVTTYTWTAFNKLETETSAMGHALINRDDAATRQKRFELGYKDSANPSQGAPLSQLTQTQKNELWAIYTTTYSYSNDGKQNLLGIVDGGKRETKFSNFDAYGNPQTKTVYTDPTDRTTPSKQLVTSYEYFANGLLKKMTGPDGAVTQYTYDNFGNRLTETDGRNNTTTYAYDGENRLLTVTDALGNVTANFYDARGNRLSVTDAAGHSRYAVYNGNNQVIGTHDCANADPARDRSATSTYDVNGNLRTFTDAEGRTTTYTWRGDNRLLDVATTAVADPTGATVNYHTSYTYDANGNQITVTDRNNNVTRFSYNADNLVTRSTDAAGTVTQYSYDANLKQVGVVIGAQLPANEQHKLSFVYNEAGELTAQIDALGNKTTTSYDGAGRKIQVIDANNKVTDFSYTFNGTGLLITETGPEVTDPVDGAPTRYSVKHQYDLAGNEVTRTNQNNYATTYTYDKRNRVVMITDGNGIKTVYRYDSRGNRTSVQIGVAAHVDGSGAVVVDSVAGAQVETYAYDEFNQLTAQTDGVGNALAASDDALYVQMRKDLGYTKVVNSQTVGKNVADLSDAEKTALRDLYTQRFTYDKVGNRKTITDHQGNVTQFDYDGLNRLVARIDALGNTALERKTTYAYDGNGNLKSEIDADGWAIISRDDAVAGDQYYKNWRKTLNYVDGSGQGLSAAALSTTQKNELLARFKTTRLYDGLNRVTDVTRSGITTHLTYDAFSNKKTETRAYGTGEAATTTYNYDLNNRLVSVFDALNKRTTYNQYDAVGNRRFFTDANNRTTEYVYDALNRNIKVIDALTFETRYEYDGAGNRITLIDAKGAITRFTYDGGNRQLTMVDAENRKTSYTYNALGDQISVTAPNYEAAINSDAEVYQALRKELGVVYASGPNVGKAKLKADLTDADKAVIKAGTTTTFEYDATHHLVAEVRPDGKRITRGYDRNYHLTKVTDARGNSTQYGFDALNRQISVTDALNKTTTYSFDASNNQLTVTDARSGVTRYTYDENGRQLTVTDAANRTTSYQYDRRGNRHIVTEANTAQTIYDYDANDRLIKATDPLGGVTTYFYDDAGNLVRKVDPIGNALITSNADYWVAQREALGYYEIGDSGARDGGRLAEHLSDADKLALSNLHATRYRYNALHQVDRITNAKGDYVEYKYDRNGHRIQVIDERGYAATSFIDKTGRLLLAVDKQGYATKYDYDASGNVISQTLFNTPLSLPVDPNGAVPVPTVDAAKDTTQRFAYDRLGRLVQQTDGEGYLTRYSYDDQGNLTKKERALDVAATAFAVTRSGYDANNREIWKLDGEGYLTVKAYYANGQLKSQTRYAEKPTVPAGGDPVAVTSARDTTTTWFYGLDGRESGKVDGEGYFTKTTYDPVGRAQVVRLYLDKVTLPVDGSEPIPAPGAASAATTYDYDANGNILSIRDPLDGIVRRTYYADGSLATETSAVGEAIVTQETPYYRELRKQLGYDIPAGSLSDAQKTILKSFFTTTYLRDGNGRVVEEQRRTWASNTSTSVKYRYDAAGNLTEVTDARGNKTVSFYDKLGRRERTVDGEGFVVQYAYDAGGRVTSETHWGNRVALPVNPAGAAPTPAPDAQRDATITRQYDLRGLLKQQTDGEGFITKFTYDGLGNLTKTERALDRAATQWAITRSWYDARGLRTARVDAEGYLTAWTHTAQGQVKTETTYALKPTLGSGAPTANTNGADRKTTWFYDKRGNAIDIVDSIGALTRQIFDAAGNVTESTSYVNLVTLPNDGTDPVPATHAKDRKTRYEYNAGNQLITITDAGGGITRRRYDANGNLTAEVNANGEALITIENAYYRALRKSLGIDVAAGSLSPAQKQTLLGYFTTTTLYNAANQAYQTIDGYGNSTKREFDANGNTVRLTDPRGNQTVTYYDKANRASKIVDGEGYVVDYVRNGNGDATSEKHWATAVAVPVDPAGTPPVPAADAQRDSTVTREYDKRGRLKQVTDGEGYVTRLTVDGAGNTTKTEQQIDRAGTQWAVTRSGFDGNGNQIWHLSAECYLTVQTFTAFNQVKDRTLYDQPQTVPAEGSAPVPVASSNDHVTSYLYYKTGKVQRETRAIDGTTNLVTQYTYDAIGNQLTQTDGYGTADQRTTTLTYDALNRLTDVSRPINDATSIVTHTNYDAAGNRTEVHEAYGTADVRKTTFTYDRNNRLSTSTNALNVVTRTEYFADGSVWRVTEADGTGDARTATFSYDRRGLKTSSTDPLGAVTTYEYDGRRNLTVATNGDYVAMTTADDLVDPVTGTVLISGYYTSMRQRFGVTRARASLTADDLKKLKDGTSVRNQYDLDGRLVGTTDARGIKTEFTVNGAGHRTKMLQAKGVAGEERTTLYDVDLIGRVRSVTDPLNHVTRYQYDALGNQTQVTDANNFIRQNTYDKLGRLLTATEAVGRPESTKTTWTYDYRGNTKTKTLSKADGTDGRTTTYTYDLLDKATRIDDAEGFTTTIERSKFGEELKITRGFYLLANTAPGYSADKAARATQQQVTRFTYDKLGRMRTMTVGDGTVTAAVYNEQKQWDITMTGEGIVTAYDYDKLNRQTVVTANANRWNGTASSTITTKYDAADHTSSIENQEGGRQEFNYDAAGRQAYARTRQTSSDWIETKREFDGNGNLTAETNPGPGTASASNRVRTEYRYDAVGNLLETRYAVGTVDARKVQYLYDLANRKIADLYASGKEALVDESKEQGANLDINYSIGTYYGYDAVGNLTKVGTNAHFTLDAGGHFADVSLDDKRITRSYFNGLRQKTAQLSPRYALTEYKYDTAGNLAEEYRYAQFVPGAVSDTTAPTLARDVSKDRWKNWSYDKTNFLVAEEVADGWANPDGSRVDMVGSPPVAVPHVVRTTYTNNSWGARASEKQFANTASPRLTSMAYDAFGRLVTSTDWNGTVTTLAYDGRNNKLMETITLATGQFPDDANRVRRTEYQFDLTNRLTRKIVYAGSSSVKLQEQAYGYDRVGNRTSVTDYFTDSATAVTSYAYDLANNLWTETRGGEGAITFGYDRVHNRTSRTDGAGTHTTYYRYDLNNRQTDVILPYGEIYEVDPNTGIGTSTTDDPATVTRYNDVGNPVEVTDARGNKTTRYFDGEGHVIAEILADHAFRTYEINAFGEVVGKTEYLQRFDPSMARDPDVFPGAPTSNAALIRTVTQEYDQRGRLVKVTYPAIEVTRLTNTGGNGNAVDSTKATVTPTEIQQYNVFGDLVKSTDRQGRSSFYFYDTNHRRIAATEVADQDAKLAYYTEYDVDQQGNRLAQRKYMQAISQAAFDDLTVTMPLAQLRPAGTVHTTSWTYDGANRVSSEILPQIEVLTYDPITNAATTALVRPTKTYTYDRAGNLASKTEGGLTERYFYNGAKRQVMVVDAAGVLKRNEYDANGNLSRTTVHYAKTTVPGNATTATTFADLSATWTDRDAAQDKVTVFTYNARNLLETQTDQMGTGTADDITTSYKYDASGNQSLARDARGNDTKTAFDSMGRVRLSVDAAGTGTVFEYDAAGNVTSAWTGKTSSNLAPAPQNPSATLVGSGGARRVKVTWQVPAGTRSWLVCSGTASHSADTNYASNEVFHPTEVTTAADGTATMTVYFTPPAVGSTLHYRIVTADRAGNVAFTAQQETRVAPATSGLTVEQKQVSGVLRWVITASFDGAVSNLQLRYGNPGVLGSTPVSFSAAGGNVYTAMLPTSVADPKALAFALRWQDAGGTTTVNGPELPFARAAQAVGVTTATSATVAGAGSQINLTTTLPDSYGVSNLLVQWRRVGSSDAYTHTAARLDATSAPTPPAGLKRYRMTLGSTSAPLAAGNYEIIISGLRNEQRVVLDTLTFTATGSAVPEALQYALGWVPPATLAGTDQLVVVNGQAAASSRGDDGRVLVDGPAALTTGTSIPYEAYYGNRVLHGAHTMAVTSTPTAGTYSLTIDGTLTPAEWNAINPNPPAPATGGLHLAYRNAGTGAFSEVILGRTGNAFRAVLSGRSAGLHDIQIYYYSANGQKVIVEWQRLNTAIASPPPITGISLEVLAQETGTISHDATGINGIFGVTPATYRGGYDIAAAMGSLRLTTSTTTGSTVIKESADGASSGYAVSFEYNALNYRTGGTDLKTGTYQRFGVDAGGRAVSTTTFRNLADAQAYGQPLGDLGYTPVSTFKSYDLLGRLKASFEGGAKVDDTSTYVRPVTRFTYDALDRLVGKQMPGAAAAWQYEYDGLGKLTREINPLLASTTYKYNQYGQLTMTETAMHNKSYQVYDALGRLSHAVDAVGNVTTYRYDLFGRKVAESDPRNFALLKLDDFRIDGTVVDANYYRRMRKELGIVYTSGIYNGQGKFFADLNDADKAIIAKAFTRQFFYDQHDRLVKEIEPQGLMLGISNGAIYKDELLGLGDDYTRLSIPSDPNSPRIAKTVAELAATSFGDGTTAIDRLRNRYTKTYVYDKSDNRTESWLTGQVTKQEFDALGRVTKTEVSSDGTNVVNRSSTTYDAFGNVDTRTNGVGGTKRFTYGAFGRLLSAIDEDGDEVKYEYDYRGLLTREYSDTAVEHRGVVDGKKKEITRGYDDYGHLIRITDEGANAETRYTSTLGGQRRSEVLQTWDDASPATKHTLRNALNTYDDLGQLTRWQDGDVAMNYAYRADRVRSAAFTDANWRPTNADGSQAGAGIINYRHVDHYYTFDANGRVVGEVQRTRDANGNAGADQLLASYSYDAAGNLRTYTDPIGTWQYGGGTFGDTFTTGFDANNRMALANFGDRQQMWRFDARGNVTRYSSRSPRDEGASMTYKTSTTYTADNKAATVISSHEYINGAGAGTTTRDQSTTTWYDLAGRATSSDIQDKDELSYHFSYAYYGDGREKSKTAFGDVEGSSETWYDVNKQRERVFRGGKYDRVRLDNEGRVYFSANNASMTNWETSEEAHHYYFANGNYVGENWCTKDDTYSGYGHWAFDQAAGGAGGAARNSGPIRVPGGASFAGGNVSYLTQQGDSLRRIASARLGDGARWAVIADANGLSGVHPDAELPEGRALRIPNTSATGTSTADTHNVYDESNFLGSSFPTLTPTPQSQCQQIGLIVAAVVAAVVVTVATWGAGAAIGGAIAASGIGAAAATATTVAATAITGFAIGAGVEAIRQEVNHAIDHRIKRDSGAVLRAGIGGAFATVGAGLSALSAVMNAGAYTKLGLDIASGAVRVGGALTNQLLQDGDGNGVPDGRISSWSALGGATLGAFGGDYAIASSLITPFAGYVEASLRGGKDFDPTANLQQFVAGTVQAGVSQLFGPSLSQTLLKAGVNVTIDMGASFMAGAITGQRQDYGAQLIQSIGSHGAEALRGMVVDALVGPHVARRVEAQRAEAAASYQRAMQTEADLLTLEKGVRELQESVAILDSDVQQFLEARERYLEVETAVAAAGWTSISPTVDTGLPELRLPDVTLTRPGILDYDPLKVANDRYAAALSSGDPAEIEAAGQHIDYLVGQGVMQSEDRMAGLKEHYGQFLAKRISDHKLSEADAQKELDRYKAGRGKYDLFFSTRQDVADAQSYLRNDWRPDQPGAYRELRTAVRQVVDNRENAERHATSIDLLQGRRLQLGGGITIGGQTYHIQKGADGSYQIPVELADQLAANEQSEQDAARREDNKFAMRDYAREMNRQYGWEFNGDEFIVPGRLTLDAAATHYMQGNGFPVSVRGDTVNLSYIERSALEAAVAGKSTRLPSHVGLDMVWDNPDLYVYGGVSARRVDGDNLQLSDRYDFDYHTAEDYPDHSWDVRLKRNIGNAFAVSLTHLLGASEDQRLWSGGTGFDIRFRGPTPARVDELNLADLQLQPVDGRYELSDIAAIEAQIKQELRVGDWRDATAIQKAHPVVDLTRYNQLFEETYQPRDLFWKTTLAKGWTNSQFQSDMFDVLGRAFVAGGALDGVPGLADSNGKGVMERGRMLVGSAFWTAYGISESIDIARFGSGGWSGATSYRDAWSRAFWEMGQVAVTNMASETAGHFLPQALKKPEEVLPGYLFSNPRSFSPFSPVGESLVKFGTELTVGTLVRQGINDWAHEYDPARRPFADGIVPTVGRSAVTLAVGYTLTNSNFTNAAGIPSPLPWQYRAAAWGLSRYVGGEAGDWLKAR